MATKKTDTFSNVAAISVTESAANTQTAAKFAFPFSIMDKMALVIQRIEYILGGLTQLNSSGDGLYVAISAAASLVDITNQADPLMIDSMRQVRLDLGAAASGMLLYHPFIKDYTNLAGGGLLVAPSPLYLIGQGVGLAGASTSWVRLYYTYMELGTDEYWQLVESRRIISS